MGQQSGQQQRQTGQQGSQQTGQQGSQQASQGGLSGEDSDITGGSQDSQGVQKA